MSTIESPVRVLNPHVALVQPPEPKRPEVDVPDPVGNLLQAHVLSDTDRGHVHPPLHLTSADELGPSSRPVQSRVLMALGCSPDDWRRLEADLRSQHLSKDATPEEHTSHGQKYAIYATLVGPSGVSADVVSVWVMRPGEEFPRFVTAYPEGGR
jgi:hypothetical protein